MKRQDHPEFRVWRNIRERCRVRKGYVDRGIYVCRRWLGAGGFYRFLSDMGPRPSPLHTIERENNQGPYRPNNCIWATQKHQARNRRDNHLIKFKGQTRHLVDWAAGLGIKPQTLNKRLDNWPLNRALTEPKSFLHDHGGPPA